MDARYKAGFLLIFVLLNFSANAQTNVGVKFFGLSIHPKGDENAFLMPRKLDKEGVLVLNLGAEVSYEKFLLNDEFSLKGVQALYSDCAAQTGGFTHLGIRAKILKGRKSSLYGGLGPTLIYRKNWSKLSGYQNPGFFSGSEKERYQYKFIWYGGEVEYAYQLVDRLQLAVSFIPGYPKLMSLAIGLTCQFN